MSTKSEAAGPAAPVLLVRGAPGGEPPWVRPPADRFGTVFLHGPGVAHAAAPDGWLQRVAADRLLVCASSWKRRYDVEPRAPFRVATLVALFEALRAAPEPVCIPVSGDPFRGRARSAPARSQVHDILLEVAFAPGTQRDRLEAAEVGLASAALELRLALLFRDAGLDQLRAAGGPWAQFADHGLAEVYAVSPAPGQQGVHAIASSEVEQLRAKARNIIVL
ncbi:MAG: hypothetical protein R3323_09505 [Wenzhouxiangellaceae bacterium]|nr:hypothetical protein [Wenzhouxiangellaceae bacterium]